MMRNADTALSVRNRGKFHIQLYDEGNNGKSTIMLFTQRVFNAYQASVPSSAFEYGQQESEILTWPFHAHGKRFFFMDEGKAGQKLDANKVKSARGGMLFTSRLPYGSLVNLKPTWKL